MSLINDALKDLDTRHNSVDDNSMRPTVPVSMPSTGRVRGGIILIVLVALAVAVYSGYELLLPATTTKQPLAVAQPVAIDSPAPVKTIATAVPKRISEKPLASTAEQVQSEIKAESEQYSEPAVDSHQQAVATLLAKIDSALADKRLTLPEDNSALFHLRVLEKLDADSVELEQRRDTLVERYTQIVEAAISGSDSQKLQRLLSRAAQLGLSLANAEHYRIQLDKMKAVAGPSADKVAPAQQLAANAGESVGAQAPVEPARVSIRKTLATVDKQTAEREQQRYQAGNRQQAIANLEQFLLETPEAGKSRITLFNLYLQAGNTPSASRLVAAVSNNSRLQNYLQARILVVENNLGAARQLLEAGASAKARIDYRHTSEDPLLHEHYNSLLGAIYQHQQEYGLALQKYKYLLSLDSNKADYWIGAALSADALEKWPTALTAFNKVLTIGNLSPDVEEYAQQRAVALQAIAAQQKIAGSTANP